LQMRRIRYKFYAKISKKGGGKVCKIVEFGTISTRKSAKREVVNFANVGLA